MELLLPVLDDDALAQAGELIELFRHRLLFHDIDETDRALDVSDNGVAVRVPAEDHLIPLDLLGILDHQDGA